MRDFISSQSEMPEPPRGTKFGFVGTDKPKSTGFDKFSGPIYPRKDWPELIALQDKNESSPWHHWMKAGGSIKDQKRTSLCWSFGCTGATEARVAQQTGWMPELSVASVAGPINGYNPNYGGWGSDHFDFVKEHGQCTTDFWPELSMDRSNWTNKKAKENRYLIDVPCYEELPAHNIEALASALLCPSDPCPVTGGFMYSFGGPHLVWLGRFTLTEGKPTLWVINSWGRDWNGNGQCKLVGESMCDAAEAIRVCGVQPISKREI